MGGQEKNVIEIVVSSGVKNPGDREGENLTDYQALIIVGICMKNVRSTHVKFPSWEGLGLVKNTVNSH